MNKFFFIICIIVFLFKTQTVFSNNLIYDVNNIQVISKINNNSDKKKLIQSAFHKAFITFINKILLTKDATSLYDTRINTIEDLVFAYQIINVEKKNKNETISTFNIKFDPKKISNFLAKNRFSYADVSNIDLTLFPVFIKGKEVFMFTENFFYNNWLRPESETTNINDVLINYNLALENIEDLEYIYLNKDNLDLIDEKKLSSLKEVQNYAFLLIYFTDGKLKTFIKTSIDKKEIVKSLNLKIYPKNETKTYREGIIALKQEINQIWKSQNLIDVSTPSFLDFYLDVKKKDDHLKMSSILNSLDLIEDYSVMEMTNTYIKVRLKYKGKINKLINNLLEEKINIKIINNTWRAKIN